MTIIYILYVCVYSVYITYLSVYLMAFILMRIRIFKTVSVCVCAPMCVFVYISPVSLLCLCERTLKADLPFKSLQLKSSQHFSFPPHT